MISGHERKARSGNAKQLIVILHGWGADGANLIDLADLWANHLPDAHFCAPNAHEICEVNPYGYQWFSLMDRSPAQMQAGVERAAREVNAFLDQKLLELSNTTPTVYGGGKGGEAVVSEASPPLSPPHAGGIKLGLVGFSQGTMTALHVGLRRADVSCILGYSGSLLEDETTMEKLTTTVYGGDGGEATSTKASPLSPPACGGKFPSICLIHGEQDDVVPFASMPRAERLLRHVGAHIETHARPGLGHSIDMEGINIGAGFLVENVT